MQTKESVIKIEINKIYNEDCIKGMTQMENDSVDFTLTDIPYDVVNRDSNGLRNLDKEKRMLWYSI